MSAVRFRLCGWVTRAILILLAVCASASAQGRKVAVYTQVEASARKDFGESERNSLTEKIRGALRNNSGGYYQPMNDEEQGVFTQYAKQRGADSFTDPKQIVPLGEQSGAQFVCVVSVRLLFGKDHEISAKIYEVRTTDLKENGTASADGKITSGKMLDEVADRVIEKMFGRRGSSGGVGGSFREDIGGGAGIDMVFVEGGTFWMGGTGVDNKGCRPLDEKPIEVTLTGFYIGKYEITQRQWVQVMGSNPSTFKGDDLPIENVEEKDVDLFIQRLNAKTGREYRVPTEAEWEYAARGGRSSRGYKYSGSNKIDDVAWYFYNSDRKTHRVGSKAPNELGIYDMTGNVSERISDGWWYYRWYSDYRYSGDKTNPTYPNRWMWSTRSRGGTHRDEENDICLSERNGGYFSNVGDGFRLALDYGRNTRFIIVNLASKLVYEQWVNDSLEAIRLGKVWPPELKKGGALTGGRSRESIQRGISNVLGPDGALLKALNNRQREKSDSKGTMTVKFVIDEFGKTKYVEVVKSTMNDPTFEKTVVNIVRSLVFEKIDKPGDVTEVTYPFTFGKGIVLGGK